jgi:quinolinate synthase
VKALNIPDPQTVAARIEALRKELGPRLVILGHHYQDETVIRHTDLQGDSLELARRIADIHAEHIVFCGVYFMAESAALLSRPGQTVYLPEMTANCVMAQMAPADLVETAVRKLSQRRRIIPLAYANSSLAVKAVAGKYGGSVCTSANARKILAGALEQGDAVLFLPDKNLACNSADRLGLPESDRHMLNIRTGGGEMDMDAAGKARLIMWPGCCAIHARFNVRQIESRRAQYPDLRVVAHPECSPAVVARSDAAGSTAFIINFMQDAPDGAAIAIGTEINLVERLMERHKGRLRIMPLVESECSHMDRTRPAQLLSTLESIADPRAPRPSRVTIDPAVAEDARAALQRMLGMR